MHNATRTLLAVVLFVILVALVAFMARRRLRPAASRFNHAKYKVQWQEIQQQCAKSETWPLAVMNADKLVDQALKTARMKGKTMGERLVSAQRSLSDNDGVWFGHKLRNRVVHEEMSQLKQRDVQAALRGFRQALKDLGVML